jgi:hypothetical protein
MAPAQPTSVDEAPGHWYFQPLSFLRPFPHCQLEGNARSTFAGHLAAAEWRLLSWLEAQGIDYAFLADTNLHFKPSSLDGFKAVVLSSHSEYWSRSMFDALRSFRDGGGWVINASGNSIFREVDFPTPSTMRCISLLFGSTAGDESALLGVRFTMAGNRTAAPYEVIVPEHWIFDGTSVRKGQLFGSDCLNRSPACEGRGASGYETDKRTSTAPPETVTVAKGLNPGGGGADMVIIERADRIGGVFSASSIMFTGSILVDQVLAQMFRNVLQRAGIREAAGA